MAKDEEPKTDFHDTMTRVSSVDQAKIERYKQERDQVRREPWFRRAEDKVAAEAARKKALRDEAQKWVILFMLFLSLVLGDAKIFEMAKQLFLG